MTPSKELREGAAYSDLGTATAPINKVIMARPIRIRFATQRRRTGTMSVAVDGDEPSGGRVPNPETRGRQPIAIKLGGST